MLQFSRVQSQRIAEQGAAGKYHVTGKIITFVEAHNEISVAMV
jgi:hypothetical protein